MPAKAKELDNRRHGDRSACPICNPRQRGRVTADALWRWSLQHPNAGPVLRALR